MRRLQSARKAWKVFTNMLQTQLHKLNKSRAIKKVPPKKRLTETRKKISWPTFLIQPQRRNKKFLFKPSKKPHRLHHHQQRLQTGTSPVYIDQLFLEHVKEERVRLTSNKITYATREERSDRTDEQESTMQAGNQDETMHTADDMWESLLLASPQMDGINERAEEFIARFRAEMQQQETLARQ